jgi:hypothetical protein
MAIFHAADDDGLAFEIGEDAAEIFVQFVAQRFVAEEWPSVLGGKDRVHENFGEGLRHSEMMRETSRGFNPTIFTGRGQVGGSIPS